MIPSFILGIAALGSFLVAIILFREVTSRKRAIPRLVITTGIVRELDTSVWQDKTGGKRGFTRVQVDFVANTQNHVCQRLWYFAGNRHVHDPGKLYTFQPGTEVGVHYDPVDPRRNALIIDQPRYGVAVIAAAVGALFVLLAVLTSR